jgi:hypothetical protein
MVRREAEQPPAAMFRRRLCSGATWNGGKASESGDLAVSHHPARVATFTVPWHGLASGADSDGRVKGATLAGVLADCHLAHGGRAPCPRVLQARAVCAGSTGGSMAGALQRAVAKRSIKGFFEQGELIFGLWREELGEGERRAGQPGAASPPHPRVSAKANLLRSTNHGGGGC